MGKNILILTGSPRKNGNSEKLANAFIKGATERGHNITKYSTGDKNIMGCKDCKTCFSKGKACSFDDDFNELAILVEKAEIIVFVSPLYWFSFPSQLKAAIDKFFSFLIGEKKLKIRESILIVCGGSPNISEFDGVILTYKAIEKHLNWKNLAVMVVSGVSGKADVEKTKWLKEAEELGKSIN